MIIPLSHGTVRGGEIAYPFEAAEVVVNYCNLYYIYTIYILYIYSDNNNNVATPEFKAFETVKRENRYQHMCCTVFCYHSDAAPLLLQLGRK